MKILLFGADGFVGRAIYSSLQTKHQVIAVTRDKNKVAKSYGFYADLLKPLTIQKAIETVRPEVIINAAGIVSNTEESNQNPIFTSNILNAALSSELSYKKIIILGSAAEYGVVDADDSPVREDAVLNATSSYGLSKVKETTTALEFRKKYKLPIIIARIFNPFGQGMHQRLLVPQIISQIEEIKKGTRKSIEISRLDTKRDYINIKDVADAIKTIVEHDAKEVVYNIGSGKSTSNKELIEYMLQNSELTSKPPIIETMSEPEALVASQADITRLKTEFGWVPKYSVEQTVKELMHGE